VVAEGLELGNGPTRFSSLVAAPGHVGLIRVLHPTSYPQDPTCDLHQDAPLETAANRSVPMDCGPNVDQATLGRLDLSHYEHLVWTETR
jgi:hypothetical protein